MKHALYLPPFGELSDVRALMDLAGAAEDVGWDGFFLWDHILRPAGEPAEIADAWVALAGVAAVTSSLLVGPMVTPLVRRRPQVLARECITLSSLSDGRLVVGVGLGVDTAGELSKFGEVVSPQERGAMLDEGLPLLVALMAGERVSHRGPSYVMDDVTYARNGPPVPVWLAARGSALRPVRRAARYDGLFPIEVDPDGLSRMVDAIAAERGSLDGFDVAVRAGSSGELSALAARGATWNMTSFQPGATVASVRAVIEHGPPVA